MRALTANRLSDGEVVFWRAGAWVERLSDAEIFSEDAPAAEAEAAAMGEVDHADDAVDHGVANGDQAVDRA